MKDNETMEYFEQKYDNKQEITNVSEDQSEIDKINNDIAKNTNAGKSNGGLSTGKKIAIGILASTMIIGGSVGAYFLGKKANTPTNPTTTDPISSISEEEITSQTEPITEEPTTEEPVIEPTTKESTTEEPTTKEQITEKPTEAPTERPTERPTEAPTERPTEAPTTEAWSEVTEEPITEEEITDYPYVDRGSPRERMDRWYKPELEF